MPWECCVHEEDDRDVEFDDYHIMDPTIYIQGILKVSIYHQITIDAIIS
jgi:hypothetical protein